MKSLSAGLGTARTETYARTLLGLVVAVAAFGAGNFAHAQPGQESSPTSTSRAAEGGYRIVEFSRPLPRAPLAAGVESEPAAAAARILEVSFSAGAGAARWYPPRRLIEVTVKFDRAVTVNTAAGTPRIDLALGTRLLGHARYASGSGSAELIFRYVTGDWNQDLRDVAVGASSLSLSGGRIDSLDYATAADLAHAAGRLDNAGARSESDTATAAATTLVALPPAAVRTPLPSRQPGAEPAQASSGQAFADGQWRASPAGNDQDTALASVTRSAPLNGVEPQPGLSLFQPRIADGRRVARAASALATVTYESSDAAELPLADIRQYRVTPAQDDVTAETSNTLRAAATGVPGAPYLWAWVAGQTQIRLQWSRGSNANPPVEDHKIEVCAEADVLDCDDDDTDDDDWTVLVERHPQASGYASNRYSHTGLAAGSTRHYRVSSRNSFGHGDPSEVKSGTTRSMPTSADCRGATWEATMTVDSFGLHDDQGYRARGKVGGGDDEGALTNYTFIIGDVTYEVNQLWFGPSVFTPTQRLGWIYHPPSYHFALSKFPGDAMQCRRPADESTSEGGCKLDDLTLYVGGLALRMSTAGYTTQTFGEAFRWSTEQETNLKRDERPTSMYEGTFNYRDGDQVEVCLTDSAPTVSLTLTPNSISENDGVSTVTAAVAQGSASSFEVTISVEADSPAVPVDFTLSENAVLSFAANATQSSGTVTITAEDNDVHALDKTLTVSGALSEGARPSPPETVRLTIENDDDEPVLSLAVAPAEIAEDADVSAVVVSTGNTTFADAQTITLTFSGSAKKGTDYGVSTEQLTLPASEHSVTATVTALHDTVAEGNESIVVTATHDNGEVGRQTITIEDDDTATLSVVVSEATIPETGGSSTVTVSTADGVTYPEEQTITLTMAAASTATESADYEVSSKELTLAAGQTEVTATVTALHDTVAEGNESIVVTATHDNGEVGRQTITIEDDDTATLSVVVSEATIPETGGSSTVTVSTADGVTYPEEQTITLTMAAASTATESADYEVSSKELTLAAGQTEVTATVTALHDTVAEGNESIVVTATHDRRSREVSVGRRSR